MWTKLNWIRIGLNVPEIIENNFGQRMVRNRKKTLKLCPHGL